MIDDVQRLLGEVNTPAGTWVSASLEAFGLVNSMISDRPHLLKWWVVGHKVPTDYNVVTCFAEPFYEWRVHEHASHRCTKESSYSYFNGALLHHPGAPELLKGLCIANHVVVLADSYWTKHLLKENKELCREFAPDILRAPSGAVWLYWPDKCARRGRTGTEYSIGY